MVSQAWYSVGNLSVTNNSAVVTGTGTQFVTFIQPGYGIVIDGLAYEVLSVDSATQLTISPVYTGTTKTNAKYAIFPTQGLNFQQWRDVVDLVNTFGPLRNNATLLNQQIEDTETYKDAAAASATAAAGSATAAAGSATAAAGSATTAGTHKDAAAASATTASTKAGEASASATAAATSASDANASKQAAATSATTAGTHKDAAAGSATSANTSKNDAQTAKTAAEAARDQAILEKGAAQTAKTAAETAKTAAETARTAAQAAEANALSHKNAAEAAAQGADTSEANAAASASAAATSASTASTHKDAAQTARTGAEAARDTTVGYRDAAQTAKLAAEDARDMAAQYAAITQDPITAEAIEAALDYIPASKEGETFTGQVNVPSPLFVRAENGTTEGGQINLERAASQGTSGNAIIDYQGNGVRVFDGVTPSRMLYYDMVNGQLQINGNYAYHDGRAPSKANVGLSNVDNTSDANKPISTATQTALNGKVSNTGNQSMTGTLTAGTTAGHSVMLGSDGNIEIQRNGGSSYIDFKSTTGQDYEARLQAVGTSLNLIGGNLTVNGNAVYHVGNKPTKGDVGLGSVDNTSDVNKPVSTATQNALNLKANLSGGNSFYNKQFILAGTGTGNSGMATSASNLGELEIQGNGTGAAMLTFHRPGSFAAYFGLDTNNKWKVGGWSMGAAAYELFHEGHAPTKAEVGLGNVDNTSDVNKPVSTAQQNALNGKLNLGGGTMSGNLTINNGSPTITFQDTDHNSAMLHCNDNRLYVLRGATNSTGWTAVNGQWPLVINLTNNDATVGGNIYARGGTQVWDQGTLTNLNQLSNGPGYINSGGRAYPRRAGDGADMNFNWSGQGGQPNWLWGGNDGINHYVYNPSNFSVNYANNSGTVGGNGIAGAMSGGVAVFTGINNSATGYVCFNGGFKIAWGEAAIVKDTISTITMPVTFASYYKPVITQVFGTYSNDFGENTYIYSFPNLSQFQICNASNINTSITWIAVGY